MKRLALFLAACLVVAGCEFHSTVAVICRGDTTPARNDTSLVKCSTLDSIAGNLP